MPNDTERLEYYVKRVSAESDEGEDRLLLSHWDDDEKPRPTPVWFWEKDSSDGEYATFRDAIDAAMAGDFGAK
jgi:hypothetical protein